MLELIGQIHNCVHLPLPKDHNHCMIQHTLYKYVSQSGSRRQQWSRLNRSHFLIVCTYLTTRNMFCWRCCDQNCEWVSSWPVWETCGQVREGKPHTDWHYLETHLETSHLSEKNCLACPVFSFLLSCRSQKKTQLPRLQTAWPRCLTITQCAGRISTNSIYKFCEGVQCVLCLFTLTGWWYMESEWVREGAGSTLQVH